jgi:hypothetical protein
MLYILNKGLAVPEFLTMDKKWASDELLKNLILLRNI